MELSLSRGAGHEHGSTGPVGELLYIYIYVYVSRILSRILRTNVAKRFYQEILSTDSAHRSCQETLSRDLVRRSCQRYASCAGPSQKPPKELLRRTWKDQTRSMSFGEMLGNTLA